MRPLLGHKPRPRFPEIAAQKFCPTVLKAGGQKIELTLKNFIWHVVGFPSREKRFLATPFHEEREIHRFRGHDSRILQL